MHLTTFLILLVVLGVAVANVLSATSGRLVGASRLSKWYRLTPHPVCIEAKFDKYVAFRYSGSPGFLAAVKFSHVSGQIRCYHAPVHNSNWGCSRNVQTNLGIFLTDWKDHVIFPTKRQAYFDQDRRWYGLAGYDGSSPELIMSNFADPIYLNGRQRLRIWYGEDLYDHGEGDNHGKVCMQVYGYLL